MQHDPEITDLLNRWRCNEPEAAARVLTAVYPQLKRLAASFFAQERPGHTLQPTALVHEAYLKLSRHERMVWASRQQFFAVAAKVMRRLLVDYARAHRRQKRGGDAVKVPLSRSIGLADGPTEWVLEVDRALRKLEERDARKAAILELHFFAGFTVAETAEAMGCSTATVTREWRMTKAFLARELAP